MKAKFRNIYHAVPYLTQGTILESVRKARNHHIQESQEVNPFPVGDYQAVRNRQDVMTQTKSKRQLTNKKKEKQKKHLLWMAGKIFTWGLKHA